MVASHCFIISKVSISLTFDEDNMNAILCFKGSDIFARLRIESELQFMILLWI